MTARSITVPLGDDSRAVGDRIDRVLCSRLESEGLSRSLIARLCEEGRVRVQGRPVKASYKLRRGDVAVVDVPPAEPIEALPENIPLTVVYEDEDLLVVDKPAGLVVHPARGHAHGTLVNAVLHHAEVDDEGDPLRPGIVHRIDRMTSGLLVVAKSVIARESLMERFRAHDIERSYVALSEGVPPSPTTYDTFYDRHPSDRVRFSSRVTSGRRAVTHVCVLESLAGARAAFLRCTLETGRTHQIRVHLADAGYPLLGDAMYGRRPRHDGVREVAEVLGRQALHAEMLGFAHPVTGAPLRFTSPPPEDFARALATLRTLE